VLSGLHWSLFGLSLKIYIGVVIIVRRLVDFPAQLVAAVLCLAEEGGDLLAEMIMAATMATTANTAATMAMIFLLDFIF
jgi:hypothetical protein